MPRLHSPIVGLAGVVALASTVALFDCSPSRFHGLTGDAPRLVSPANGAYVMGALPTLVWNQPLGFTEAMVELCADAACERSLETIHATGGAATAESDFSHLRARDNGQFDNIVYWRVHVGKSVSRTWEFRPVPGRRKVDTSWGNLGDFNADAVVDLAIGVPDEGVVRVFPVGFHGQATSILDPCGLPQAPPQLLTVPGVARLGAAVAIAGDIDGDGYVDLLAGDGASPSRVFVFHGGVAGLGNPLPIEGQGPGFGKRVAGVGDVDGDGYADAIASDDGATVILWGSSAGLGNATRVSAAVPDLGCNLSAAGDLDGDRLADFAVAADCGGDGRLFVAFGSKTRAVQLQEVPSPTGIPGLGTTLALAGDGNADGLSEVFAGGRSPTRGALVAANRDRGLFATVLEDASVPGFGAGASFDITLPGTGDDDDEFDSGASAFWAAAPLVVARGDATRAGNVLAFARSLDGGVLEQVPAADMIGAELFDVRPGGPLVLARGGKGQAMLYPDCVPDGGQTWTTLTDGITLVPAR